MGEVHYALYFSRYCYFCLKVLQKLHAREHGIELRDVASGAHREDLIEGGGKSQVPCLLVSRPGGEDLWIYESDDIIGYIDRHQLAG